jgi:hypothetical protein
MNAAEIIAAADRLEVVRGQIARMDTATSVQASHASIKAAVDALLKIAGEVACQEIRRGDLLPAPEVELLMRMSDE